MFVCVQALWTFFRWFSTHKMSLFIHSTTQEVEQQQKNESFSRNNWYFFWKYSHKWLVFRPTTTEKKEETTLPSTKFSNILPKDALNKCEKKGDCKCKCSLQFILRFVTHQNICYQIQQVVKWKFHCTTYTHTFTQSKRISTMCTSLAISFSLFFSFYQSKNSMFSNRKKKISLKCQGFVNQKFLFTFLDGRRYSIDHFVAGDVIVCASMSQKKQSLWLFPP